jgi:1-acyl-sn-glycerol-3-phosphate acyltransferase
MTSKREYLHAQWEPIRHFLRFFIDYVGFRYLAKIDSVEGAENIPPQGAGIIYYNHIAFIDPVAVLTSVRRNAVPIAKAEASGIPFWGVFPKLWGSIMIRRGEADRSALQQAVSVLESGELLLVAPEGTRNPALRNPHDGMAYLAARTGAPVIPAAIEGTEGFPSLSPRRWSLPGASIRFGQPFRFRFPSGRIPREWLRKMTDEAMYRLASLLPPARRGVYSDLRLATTETIELLSP